MLTLSQSTKRVIRVTRLALHVLRGLLIAAFMFPLQSAQRRKREIEHWSFELLHLLNVRLFLHGRVPGPGGRAVMLVANHVSWLDIFAIDAIVPARFVAKAEVRRWPLLGWLATFAGTVYIERSRRRDTGRINGVVSALLSAGEVMAVFPEGTTTDGSTVLRFHASLLEPALQAEALIQPVAIWYDRSDGSLCTEAAYASGKTMWQTLMGITSQHEVLAHVCFLDPIEVGSRHRREVAAQAQEAITRVLFPHVTVREPQAERLTAGWQ